MPTVCSICGSPGLFEYTAFAIEKFMRLQPVGERFTAKGRTFTLCEGPLLVRDDGKVLKPTCCSKFGPLWAYWLDSEPVSLATCSRPCAIRYAETQNAWLIKQIDGTIITPHNARFDRYSHEHGIDSHLATINDARPETPEAELRRLIHANLLSPARLFSLAAVVLDAGKHSLAEAVIQKVTREYPLEAVVGGCGALLCRMGKPGEIDPLYMKLADQQGGIERIDPAHLSFWAMCLGSTDRSKALKLSSMAVAALPTTYQVIENHISVLLSCSITEARAFIEDNYRFLRTDVGYHNAGLVYLHCGDYPRAEEYFRLADPNGLDPSEQMYLAECLFRLRRYEEALVQVISGLKEVETFKFGAVPDFDGHSRLRYEHSYSAKRYQRSMLIFLKGKILCAQGETASGLECIHDAIDTFKGEKRSDPILSDIDEYLSDYPPRAGIERELADARRSAQGLLEDSERRTITVERLSSLIDAIGLLQSDWNKALTDVKTEIVSDLVGESFSCRIHAFCLCVRNLAIDVYEKTRAEVRQRFPHLPGQAIEQIANGSFLLEQHGEERIPVFAGVVIELCKAVETSANSAVVWPFVAYCLAGRRLDLSLGWNDARGTRRKLDVTSSGRARHLMMGELVQLCECGDARWLKYLQDGDPWDADWIRHDLGDLLRVIKNDHRNGCAHYSSADVARATGLADLLKSTTMFERLDGIASRLSSRGLIHYAEG